MNWYKEIKFASPPIAEEYDKWNRDKVRYFDIAHRGADREFYYLWFIDASYKFYITHIIQYARHPEWTLFNEKYKDVIASGRYNMNTNTASMALETNPKYISKFNKEYVKKEVSRILDKKLNNPKIIFFG